MFDIDLFLISAVALPAILAISLHEAAHGYAAHLLGDDTAKNAGRLTANPIAHIDPVGTILIPGMLLLTGAPFIFGFAKPVPVDWRNLRNPRKDMMWVALAGPGCNLVQAAICAMLLFFFADVFPREWQEWIGTMLSFGILINLVLAAFNMLPIPPLDGGRVAVGLLPAPLARKLAALEPFGIFIVIGIIMLLHLYLGS